MNPATIAALATAIVSIIGAITAAIVAIKGNSTATSALNSASYAHQRLNQVFGQQSPVEKDPN